MHNPIQLYESLRKTRPATRTDLKNYVKVFLHLDIPDKQICPDHNSPLDYLWHSFNSDFSTNTHTVERRGPRAERRANADCIVWANRAGGKTELAAVATLLDCIFKPNCQSRILAGSGEQSFRLYEYFLTFLPQQVDKCLHRLGVFRID